MFAGQTSSSKPSHIGQTCTKVHISPRSVSSHAWGSVLMFYVNLLNYYLFCLLNWTLMRNNNTKKIINAPIPKARGFCGKGVLTPSSIWMTFDGISPNPCSSATIYNGTKRIATIRNRPIPPNALAFNLNLVINHQLGKLQVT